MQHPAPTPLPEPSFSCKTTAKHFGKIEVDIVNSLCYSINNNKEMAHMKCSVCGTTIKKDPVSGWDGGHNAHPVNDGRCCDDCNTHIVIPLRINNLFGKMRPVPKEEAC